MLNNKLPEKEENIDISVIKRSIKDFTLETLENYCKNNEDNADRVIARASEILINRYPYELNLIITQLCTCLSGIYSEEEEAELIREFKVKWFEQGLAFD